MRATYKPLPDDAVAICRLASASPRLIAHLTLVHDTAFNLVDEIQRSFPDIRLNAEDMLFGAATHDIGKAVHSEELSVAGNRHEAQGAELLLSLGVPAARARFAATHGKLAGKPYNRN